MRAIGGMVLVVALAGTSAASPGDLPDPLHDDEAPPLTILDAASTPCAAKAALCVAAGARSTIVVATAPAEATPDAPAPKPAKNALPPPPRLSRAASLASNDGAPTPAESAPWTVEVSGALKHAAWAGNALFLFFDLDDPDALPNRQFTALYQAPLKASPKLAARIRLSPDDGFRPGHTYRLRIVQLINGREIVLGESDLSLL